MRAWRRQACAARAGGTGRTRAAREGGGGTSCPGARAQLCARAPSPAHAACAQQIHPRPRPVGQAHGLGLVVRADGDARAARQSSTSTPPPRASMAPPSRERFRRPQVWRRGGSHGALPSRQLDIRRVFHRLGASAGESTCFFPSRVAPFTRSDEPGPF